MLRSLSSAISALRNHQAFMDVLSTNISNINTVGYKSSRVSFQDLLSQTLRLGGPPGEGSGGINPLQIGLGMQLGGVSTIFTQGSLRATGRATDLAIQGDGFFVFQSGTERSYSRDGSIDVGLNGMLLNSVSGMLLLGWQANTAGEISRTGEIGAIQVPFGVGEASGTSRVTYQGNLNLNHFLGTETTIADTVEDFVTSEVMSGRTELASDTYHVEIQGAAASKEFRVVDGNGDAVSIYDAATDDGTTFTDGWQDVLDVLGNFADGVVDTGLGLTIDFDTVEADFANGTKGAGAASVVYNHGDDSPVISGLGVYDTLGQLHTLTLTFVRTDVSTWEYTVTESDDFLSVTSGATGTVSFSEEGACTSTNPILVVDYTNGAAGATVALDFGDLTQLSGASNVGPVSQDGLALGSLVDFSVNEYGEVLGLFSNGLSKLIGQVAMATFSNPGGLLRMGQNLFVVSSNSGLAQIGLAGEGKRGIMSSGFLEMSNVDLAREFTDMIVAQRGFQANARVVSTSDDILQEVVNLKR